MSGYDIHFQPVPAGEVRGYKCFEFGFQAALKVKGPQALVNRWVKTLMTPLGSDPLYPSEGTTFSGLVGGNVSGTSVNIEDLVSIAFQEASDQVRRGAGGTFLEEKCPPQTPFQRPLHCQ